MVQHYALLVLLLVFSSGWESVEAEAQKDKFLSAHNVERWRLGIPPLVWDKALEAYAGNYAAKQDRILAGCFGALQHSNGPYGENLYWYWTSTNTLAAPSQAVGAWISERQHYSYKTNRCSSGYQCGHYTQVVWARTRRVGCVAHACSSKRGATYIICNYYPPGNYIGQPPF